MSERRSQRQSYWRRILGQTFVRWGARLGLLWVGILAFLGVFSAILLVAGVARFLMDYGQLRVAIPSESRADFDASTLRALISATLAVPVLFALGARCLAHSRNEDTAAQPLDEPVDPRSYVIPFRHRQPR